MITIKEELSTYDLSNEELQEGIDALNDILDSLTELRNFMKDRDYNIDRNRADDLADKLFNICDVPYLSDYIDDISTILNNLGRTDTTSRYVLGIINKIVNIVVSILRELEYENEQRERF